MRVAAASLKDWRLARIPLGNDRIRSSVEAGFAWVEKQSVAAGSTPDRPAVSMPRSVTASGQLDYYRRRQQDFLRRHPGQKAPRYYLTYGDKYVRRFSAHLAPELSPEGQAWLIRARRQLQEAMEAARSRDPVAFDRLEQDDQAFTRFAYATHVRAYLQAGFQDLPAADLMHIVSGLDRRDLVGAMAAIALIPFRTTVRWAGRKVAGAA